MSPLLDNPVFQAVDRLLLGPVVESAILIGVYALVKAVSRRVRGADVSEPWIAVPLIAAILAFLTHGGAAGQYGPAGVAALAFACFGLQLVWMRPRFGLGVTFYGLWVSHSSANVVTLFW
ncbi:hypothetical protein ACWCOP_09735 [Maricaulaceae bacterium MS644]